MTTLPPFNFKIVHPSWKECLDKGLHAMDTHYLNALSQSRDWLPGQQHIFSAFSLPLDQVNYILFGESPYPRQLSANGYAFWDAAVKNLWSPTGLDKKVNRATSLRNILKMLLIAEGFLKPNHAEQVEIAKINKLHLVQTNDELFTNFLNHGFLLLNACMVLRPHSKSKQKDAKAWSPFIEQLLHCLLESRPKAKFILFGSIAKVIDSLISDPHVKKLYAEHPYNHSFITNSEVINFFKPLHLLINQTPT